MNIKDIPAKKFQDLQPLDPIYHIGISTKKVVAYYVKEEVKPHPENKEVSIVKFYKIPPVNNINVLEVIKTAKLTEQEPQFKVITLLVLGNETLIATLETPPRVYGTSQEQLEAWIKETAPKKNNIILPHNPFLK